MKSYLIIAGRYCRDRSGECLFFSISLAILFVCAKVLLLATLGLLTQVSPSQFGYDLLTGLIMGVGAFLGRGGRMALVFLAMAFYGISMHLAAGGGDYLDATTIRYLKDGADMADNIWNSVPWMGYSGVLLLAGAYIFWAEPFLLPRFLSAPRRWQVGAVLGGVMVTGVVFCWPHPILRTATYRNPLEYLVTDAFGTSADMSTDYGALDSFSRMSRFPSGGDDDAVTLTSRASAYPFNVVVLLMESTSFQSLNGMETKLMPAFWQLAEHGVVYDAFYANVPLSLKTIKSVHAGCDPAADWQYISRSRPGLPLKTLPQYLKEEGYRTALLHGGHFSFSDKLAYLGDKGYDLKYDGKSIPDRRSYKSNSWGIDDRAIYDYASKWVGRTDEPFFIMFIPIAPHMPYDTPDDFEKKRYVEDEKHNNYLNAVRYADSLMGAFIDDLKRKGVYDNTLFLVMGDHGEAFRQHYENWGHSLEIYDENVRVPMVVSNSRLFPNSSRSEQPASHADILPTVLDLLQLDAPFYGQGHSLLALPDDRMVFLYTKLRGQKLGLRDGLYKYIYRISERRHELFRLDDDPFEKKNIASRNPERVAFYHDKVMEWSAYSRRYIKYVNAKGELMSVTSDNAVSLIGMPIYFSAPKNRVKINQSETGRPFKVGRKVHDVPGIGTHAPSIVTYDVSRFRGKRFTVQFAHDDGSGKDSRIKAQLWMDGKVVYDGEPITKKTSPQSISIYLRGQLLSLVAMEADDGSHYDHVNWMAPTVHLQ